jgi:hypothetical protein
VRGLGPKDPGDDAQGEVCRLCDGEVVIGIYTFDIKWYFGVCKMGDSWGGDERECVKRVMARRAETHHFPPAGTGNQEPKRSRISSAAAVLG